MAEAQVKQSPGTFRNDILRWIGIVLIAGGAIILFSSYIYVPLNIWSNTPWNPATWTYDFGSAYYALGWVGVIPLVVGVVLYAVERTMKPKAKE